MHSSASCDAGLRLDENRKDGIRRADLRAQFITNDHEAILMRYDIAIIKASDVFLNALQAGQGTAFESQYMRMSPKFGTNEYRYSWLEQNVFIGAGKLAGNREIGYNIFRVM